MPGERETSDPSHAKSTEMINDYHTLRRTIGETKSDTTTKSNIMYNQDQTPGNYETTLKQQQKVILIATTHNSKFIHSKDILDDAALQVITTCFFGDDVVELDLVDTNKLGPFMEPS